MDNIIGKRAYKKHGAMAGMVGTIEKYTRSDKFPYVLRFYVDGKDIGEVVFLSVDDIVIVE